MHYPVVIHKDPDSDYGVTVPDILECFSAGETIEEALVSVGEAIECHIEGLLISEEEIPLPTPIENHYKNTDYFDGIWAVVDIDLTKLYDDSSHKLNLSEQSSFPKPHQKRLANL